MNSDLSERVDDIAKRTFMEMRARGMVDIYQPIVSGVEVVWESGLFLEKERKEVGE